MAGPWGVFATVFNKAFGTQAEGEKARTQGEYLNNQSESPLYTYQTAPNDSNRESYSAGSPHQIGMNLDIAGASMGHPMKQVLGQAIAGNEAWMAPEVTSRGGYVSNPWQNIYMKYGRGK